MLLPDITKIRCGIIIFYNTSSGAINAASFNNEHHEGTYYGPTTLDAIVRIYRYISQSSDINKYFIKLDTQQRWEYLNRLVKKHKLGRLILQIED